ncbi:GNAT family N-acetyltransferase [Limibacter armeniacum]|uniref:GNAT family N-acetyltransferase n=1 Tax=Limibacter armeniacum TaxID=466084 RepID=UPI002FE5ABD3
MSITVQTERLQLCEATLEDGRFFYELLNTPSWIEFIGDRGIRTLEDAESYIQQSLISSYLENGFGLYKMVLREKNQPIGLCGLVKRSDLKKPDIGFAILPEYEGKGLVFEAAVAVLEYARQVLGQDEVWAITTEENLKSRRLIERIGLGYVKHVQFDADQQQFLLYSNKVVTQN